MEKEEKEEKEEEEERGRKFLNLQNQMRMKSGLVKTFEIKLRKSEEK